MGVPLRKTETQHGGRPSMTISPCRTLGGRFDHVATGTIGSRLLLCAFDRDADAGERPARRVLAHRSHDDGLRRKPKAERENARARGCGHEVWISHGWTSSLLLPCAARAICQRTLSAASSVPSILGVSLGVSLPS